MTRSSHHEQPAPEVETLRWQTPDHRVVILGAGRGAFGHLPSAVVSLHDGRGLLDWLLDAFQSLPRVEVVFIGGYMASEVVNRYPGIRFVINEHWRTTGSGQSLVMAPLDSKHGTFVSYADVVYRPETVRHLAGAPGDIVLAVDRAWQHRFEGRDEADLQNAEKVVLDGDHVRDVGKHVTVDEAHAEFCGILKLSPRAAQRMNEFSRSEFGGQAFGVPEVIATLITAGVSARAVDVSGDWAELNAPQDLARFVLGTKAETLERLRSVVRRSRICQLAKVTAEQWQTDPESVLDRIEKDFAPARVIIRSSAVREDGWEHSAAGSYLSVSDVDSTDRHRISGAVEQVLASYGETDGRDQVLVQPMLENVECSGVVVTRTPTTGAPYWIIGFDDRSGRTDTVTSGTRSGGGTVFLHRGSRPTADVDRRFGNLLGAVREVEQLVGHDSLDLEFAVTEDKQVHMLQVRPLTVVNRVCPVDDERVALALRQAASAFTSLQRPAPFLLGRRTALSNMSDWNPAEMIGAKPRRLACSLYEYLITDELWARQRAEFGYRDVRPCRLLVDVAGHPYVDLRADFNSFIPGAISQPVGEQLVDAYLDHLERHPELHDKVEFEVVPTCWTFDFNQQTERFRDTGLQEGEWRDLEKCLFGITAAGIRRCAVDHERLQRVSSRYEQICRASLEPLDTAYLLLEEVRHEAALVFAHLARNAFVAANILRSLERLGTISPGQQSAFHTALRTVSSLLQEEAWNVREGCFPLEQFEAKYGHLRPGTYEITSPCYAAAPDEYLRPIVEQATPPPRHPAPSAWSDDVRRKIDSLLKSAPVASTAVELEHFCRQAIEGREFSKFIFTRHVSRALECIAEYGDRHGVSREDLAHVRIAEILSLRSAPVCRPQDFLEQRATEGQEAYAITQCLSLPSLVFSADDLVCFQQRPAEPNFVTSKVVQGPTVVLPAGAPANADVEGAVVLITNADPGYDWLFSRRIAGLITMYGGINSHMAVRAAEFELPAAIGVGEQVFDRLRSAREVLLDCRSHRLWPITDHARCHLSGAPA